MQGFSLSKTAGMASSHRQAMTECRHHKVPAPAICQPQESCTGRAETPGAVSAGVAPGSAITETQGKPRSGQREAAAGPVPQQVPARAVRLSPFRRATCFLLFSFSISSSPWIPPASISALKLLR